MTDVPFDLLPVFQKMAGRGVLGGDVAKIAGWVFVESGFEVYAVRWEPAFFGRYVSDDLKATDRTEARCRAMSWGLFQVMGQVARERGFDVPYLPELCRPRTNARLAEKHLRWGKERGDGSWAQALAAYNGGLGGNRENPYRRQAYVDKVLRAAQRFDVGQCEAP